MQPACVAASHITHHIASHITCDLYTLGAPNLCPTMVRASTPRACTSTATCRQGSKQERQAHLQEGPDAWAKLLAWSAAKGCAPPQGSYSCQTKQRLTPSSVPGIQVPLPSRSSGGPLPSPTPGTAILNAPTHLAEALSSVRVHEHPLRALPPLAAVVLPHHLSHLSHGLQRAHLHRARTGLWQVHASTGEHGWREQALVLWDVAV